MDKKTKLSLLLIVIGTFTLASVTMAANVLVKGSNLLLNSNITSSILDTTAGSGLTSNSGIAFGTVSINMASTIGSITGTDYIRVDDNRGKNAGWNVSISATDFTATDITDETVSTGTISVSIPANAMLMVHSHTPTALNSSDLSNVTARNIGGISVTGGTGVKVLTADKGYGQGVYKQQLDYALSVPNYLPPSVVITASDAASKFLPANRTLGAKIGLFEATYTSTISYNINTGP